QSGRHFHFRRFSRLSSQRSRRGFCSGPPGQRTVEAPSRGGQTSRRSGADRRTPEPGACPAAPVTRQPARPDRRVRPALPFEVLLKILSYLDASSLICVSHVSTLFHRLANDDFIWRNIYTSEFESPAWKPKLATPPSPPAVKEEPHSAGSWKKKFFRRMREQDMEKWRKDLRKTCPHTSLPQQTEAVLRNLKMSWELALTEHSGQKTRLDQNRASFFESSVVVSWSCRSVLHFQSICSISVYGVRKEAGRSFRSCSLASMVTPSTWFCTTPASRSCWVTSASCPVAQRRRLLELRFISRTSLLEHRLLSGGIGLPWRSEELLGVVENCCFLTLTLLDIHQKPFWCLSSPVSARMAKAESCYYSGDHFLMEHQHADGEVRMKLVWLTEQNFILTEGQRLREYFRHEDPKV
uniref:F-box only protein 15-like n=1 Tax=Oryzias melastigma TaxID=30732 RepID=A0A3B3DZT1_ORYME